MATVLEKLKESIAGNTLIGKKASPKISKKGSYIICSVYYNDAPEGGTWSTQMITTPDGNFLAICLPSNLL